MKTLFILLLGAACAACGDQTATQYVGTTMNDANPETSARFTLTLYSRSDTSFAGILELGPPETGTGSAYAWYHGPELKIISVAAAGSDTMLWTSKLSDEELGGQYEITGGKRVGQHGTWRARLTKGLPATPATLRSPRTLAPPPVSALGLLLLAIISAAWLALWIRRTPEPVIGDAGIAVAAPEGVREYAGISGWLALFVAGQVIGAVPLLMRLRELRTDYDGGMGVGAAVRGMQSMVVLEVAMQLVAPVIMFVGVVLIVRRDRYAPRYWSGYFALSAVYLAVDLTFTAFTESELKRLLGAGYDASAARGDAVARTMIRQIIVSLLWALYWVRSRRVRATFGAAALDRTAFAVRGSAMALTAARAPRRRWRTVLRAAGAIVAGVVVIAGVGLWEMRVSAYSVPAGNDIRKTVAGRWTWTTDKKGCANAHIIAFSDDGKIMTIVQPSSDIGGGDASTTTYDITLVTQSTIRGAIRGETRLTDDGKPVVWDLVLVGPDTYRWRRTDWSSAWSYTPSIVRCPGNGVAESPAR